MNIINEMIKKSVMGLIDAILIYFALFFSVYLRSLGNVPDVLFERLFNLLLPSILINLFVFSLFGLYRREWNFASLKEFVLIAGAVTIGMITTYIYSLYSGMLPRSSYVIAWFLIILLIVGLRYVIIPVSGSSNNFKEKINIINFINNGCSFRNMLIIFITMAVIVNILQFRAIDERAIDRYKAINRYETSDIMEIGYQSSPRHRQRYSPAIALGEHAPGSTIIIPNLESFGDIVYKRSLTCDCLLEECVCLLEKLRFKLLTIGQAADVIQKPYAVGEILHGYDVKAYFIDSGEESYLYLPWAIAVGGDFPNEFIYVQWQNSFEGPYDLLIDTSLLPDNVRKELDL